MGDQATAAELLRRARVCMRRAARNWVRDSAGDELVARRYWEEADRLRFLARTYVSERDYVRLLSASE